MICIFQFIHYFIVEREKYACALLEYHERKFICERISKGITYINLKTNKYISY